MLVYSTRDLVNGGFKKKLEKYRWYWLKRAYDSALRAQGFAPITTEILPAPEFYFAEDYHQQYLAKNPRGYCGLGGTGVSCPIGTGVSAETS